MDVMDFDLDEEDDLSTALGTESLAAGGMVPEGFDNTPRASSRYPNLDKHWLSITWWSTAAYPSMRQYKEAYYSGEK